MGLPNTWGEQIGEVLPVLLKTRRCAFKRLPPQMPVIPDLIEQPLKILRIASGDQVIFVPELAIKCGLG